MVDVPFDEVQKLAGAAQLTYSEGYPGHARLRAGADRRSRGRGRAADVALLYVALPGFMESEGYDRADLDLTPQQVALIQAVCAAQPHTVVILNNGSALAMSEWIDGAAAVLEAWMMGQAGGGAIADVLFGQVNPSGKLAETFPLRSADTPATSTSPAATVRCATAKGSSSATATTTPRGCRCCSPSATDSATPPSRIAIPSSRPPRSMMWTA